MNKSLSISDGFHPRYILDRNDHFIYHPNVIHNEIFALPEEAILQSLLENYDHDTSVHARRIVLLVEAVAWQLGLAEEEIFLTCLAALLHDIGKAGIPASILHKPGPLDECERQVMHAHTEIGQRMLLEAGGIFALLGPIVVAHHEHWDGGGYPAGLMGEEIPLGARIIAVVDSYDAIAHHRIYRKGQSMLEACDELQRCAGSQYDPHIVATFHALLYGLPEQGTYTKRSRAVGEAELAGAMCVVPSLQSDGYVPVSA